MNQETQNIQLYPYLSFSGNCRNAMQFYQGCLGGILQLQTVGDSPLSDQMPSAMKNLILHSKLVSGSLVMMGSDMLGDLGLHKGNQVALMLACRNEESLLDLYKRLSAGGAATQPLRHTFWGALYGELMDPYGQQWLLHCDERNRPWHEK